MSSAPAGEAELEIRRATEADEAALGDLDLVTRSPAVTPAPDREPEYRFFAGRARPEGTLVATLDRKLVGVIALAPPTQLASNAHVLEVCELAVAPEHQGRGIGRALADAAVELACERGARRVTLRVLSTNGRAQRAYEAWGFEVEGRLRSEFLLAGEYVDDILMARTLGD